MRPGQASAEPDRMSHERILINQVLNRSVTARGADVPGAGGPRRDDSPVTRSIRSAVVCGLSLLGSIAWALPAIAADPRTPSELYQPTKVWTIHLKIAADQWAAMEPKGGAGMFGPPPGPDGENAFGPGSFYAPMIVRRGDADASGGLSRQEFLALGDRWFSDWDKAKSGKIDAKALRDGLNTSLEPTEDEIPKMNLQGAEGKRNGIASVLGFEFQHVHADLEFEGRNFPDVALRYKGNGTFLESRNTQKRSFKIDVNKYVKGRRLAGETTLNLHNNVTDPGSMNEILAYRLYRDAGVPAPRGTYARVLVTVPGKFDRKSFGLYTMIENVDKNFAAAQLGTDAGALLKPVTPDLFADLGDDWAKYAQTYDPKTPLAGEQSRRVIEFCKLVSRADDAEFAARVGDYLDLDRFARYMAVLSYLCDLDGILGPGQNIYLHLRPATKKFEFIPWDQDHSFGQFPVRGNQDEREDLSLDKPWDGKNRFLDRVFRVPAFRQRYRARLDEFSANLFRPERFDAQVAEIAAIIRPSVEAESKSRLASFDKATASEFTRPPAPKRGFFGGGMPQSTPIRPFVRARSRSVADQLAGRSNGRTLGSTKPAEGAENPFEGFRPGAILGGPFLTALDADADKNVSRDELASGFAAWFDAWKPKDAAELKEAKLRSAMNKALAPFGGGLPRVAAAPKSTPPEIVAPPISGGKDR